MMHSMAYYIDISFIKKKNSLLYSYQLHKVILIY